MRRRVLASKPVANLLFSTSLGLVLLGITVKSSVAGDKNSFFRIQVVDEQTGRGVPLVLLETVDRRRFYTDSAGVVAFREPGLMDREVWFGVSSQGYEHSKDGFGMAGVRLKVVSGERAEVKIKRLNIAERLYRITGAGIYRDTVLLGERAPIEEPVLNAQVVGQDSSVPAVYHGRIRWFWGDTAKAEYPLGNFAASGATSDLPGKGGLAPWAGINLHYFTNAEGFSRAMAPVSGGGAVWIEQPLVVTNQGREAMLTRFIRNKQLGEVLEQGLMLYDDGRDQFEKLLTLDLKERWRFPAGRPLRWSENGEGWFCFARPFATVRVRSGWNSITNPAVYEALTCLAPGRSAEHPVVMRDGQGGVVWSWRSDVEPLGQKAERDLIRRGLLKPEEARYALVDVDSGESVEMHHASIHWNEYRHAWILIGVQIGGRTSYLGEVWFADAPSPFGPWRKARRIVTHEKYSFYNPAQIPFFDEAGGRYVYFEGTYSETFSGNASPTPLYDYNQMLYRLDLADPRLAR